MFPDVTGRNHNQAPPCDWFAAGFPCQPFSTAGLNQGVLEERGLLVQHTLRYLDAKRPELVLLENVAGLLQTKKHRPLLAFVLVSLQESGYRTWHKIVNSVDHGLPQHRPRLYIVAIQSARVRRSLAWPEPVPCLPVDEFLRRPCDKPTGPRHESSSGFS